MATVMLVVNIIQNILFCAQQNKHTDLEHVNIQVNDDVTVISW